MKFFLSILFFLFLFTSVAQKYSHHEINVNYGRGILLGHKGIINHLPQKASNLFDLSYTKYSSQLPGFGIGINYVKSGNKNVIGDLKGIYGFTNLIVRKKDSALRVKIGFGLGHVEKIFDPNTNNKNIAIGSHLNAIVVFKIEKNYSLNNHAIYLGGGVTHFSNGSSQTPNLGLNFISINAGYSLFKLKKKQQFYLTKKAILTRQLNFGIAYRLGMRENIEPFRKKYAIQTFSLYSIYSKNEKRNYLGGLDLFYNPSVTFYSESTSKLQLGIFVGKEWIINKLILGIDLGAYVFDQHKRDGIAYQRLNISYFITQKLKATFLLKSHLTVAQAFQLGIAYEIKK